MDRKFKFGVLGCGFWAKYQISGWKELDGVELVALYNRTHSKAEDFAREFVVPKIYDTPEQMMSDDEIDFVDIITDVAAHSELVHLAAKYRKPVICQKPMARSLDEGKTMVEVCKKAGVPFMVHENWRWQRPIRKLKEIIDSGAIGKTFRCNFYFNSSFPVYDNQPFLAEIDQLIIADLGIHILDTARFLFGDAQSLYCQTSRANSDIKGEDVATIMMLMGDVTCLVQISHFSILEDEKFPQTFALIEGDKGSVRLGLDYRIGIATREGTHSFRVKPVKYSWADPDYTVVQSSIVPTNANWLECLKSGKEPETSGEDNLKTLELVYSAYESAKMGKTIRLG